MEQDKPTLVPAVLSDLVDVDGTPSVGDTLQWDGTAWAPQRGDANTNGPKRTIYQSLTTGLSVVDDYAGIGVEPTNDYDNWTPWDVLEEPDNAPGEWVLDGRYKYRFTRAGVFTVTTDLSATVSGGNHVAGNMFYHRIDESLGIMFESGPPRATYTGIVGGTGSLGLANSTGKFRVPQALVDAGGWHLDFSVYFMRASGSTVVSQLSAYIYVDQWVPDDHAPAFGL